MTSVTYVIECRAPLLLHIRCNSCNFLGNAPPTRRAKQGLEKAGGWPKGHCGNFFFFLLHSSTACTYHRTVALYAVRSGRYLHRLEPLHSGDLQCSICNICVLSHKFLFGLKHSTLLNSHGSVVKWYHTCLPSKWLGFDSRRIHHIFFFFALR